MAVTALSIIHRVVDVLQDTGCTGWTVGELARWFNDGQREVVTIRPDALTTFDSVALVAGTRQTLPAGSTKLLDVVRNTGGSKTAVRMIDREQLDEQAPGWHAATPAAEILHAMFDGREPRAFWVYPPAANAGAAVDALYGVLPTDIAEPGAGDYTAISGNSSLNELFINPLVDYVLYRAYSKNSDEAGDASRAVAHYTAFLNALGAEVKATVAAAPVKATSNS